MPLIEVDHVIKEFRRPKRQAGLLGGLRTLFTRQQVVTRAVDDISFAVDAGELIGYLGANGAGKSTTIKLITGVLVPSAGSIRVAGRVPWRERERNALEIGVVFGQRSQLWWDLPLVDSLQIIAKLYRMAPADARRNLDRFSELLGLEPFLATPVRQLSLDQRMRGDLAAAMLYEPRILYLDEPTIGLDVVAKERIRGFIAAINREQGTTVILTTHDLDDVERLCRRILLIDGGKVQYDGTVAELKRRYAPYRELVVQLAPDEPAEVDGALLQVDGAALVRSEGVRRWLRFDPTITAVPALVAAVAARATIADMAIVEPELEQVLHALYAEQGTQR